MAINNVANWQGNGCIIWDFREFLGHNFVSGISTLKPKKFKTFKNL